MEFLLQIAKLQFPPLASTLLLLSFLYYCLIRWKSNNKTHNNTNRKLKQPPEPAGSWPLIGHLHLLLGNDAIPHIVFAKLADKFGPIFMVRLGTKYRALVVNSSEMAKECLSGTNDRVFLDRPQSVFVNRLCYDSAIFAFTRYGSYWHEMRKIATLELLSNRRIEMMKNLRLWELKSCIKEIHDNYKKSNTGLLVIDMKEWFENLILNTMTKLVVGKSFRESFQGEEYDKYKKALRKFFELGATLTPNDAFPFLRWLDIGGYERAMKKAAKEIDDMMQGWLEEHKRRRSEDGDHEAKGEQDFMDIMLDMLEKEQLKPSEHDADTMIKATCMTMIFAGTGTTSVTLIWALSLLLNNKDSLRKAQVELDVHIGKDKKVNESDLNSLIYLQAIFKETTRLYPAGPMALPREAIKDCTINNYHVRAGTWLFMNLYKIHRDPRVWQPDPLEFRPERFLIDSGSRLKDFDELMPFGIGTRACPGISLAHRTVPLTLATLLHGFEMSTHLGEPVDMTEGVGMSYLKAFPVQVIFKPRLHDDIYDIHD